MNAYELAVKLETKHYVDGLNIAAKMLRQQADEKAELTGKFVRLADENNRLKDRIATLETQVDKLLAHCDDPECWECGKIICPYGGEMHFHHDGCPTCAQMEDYSGETDDGVKFLGKLPDGHPLKYTTPQTELNAGGEPVKNATYWKRQHDKLADRIAELEKQSEPVAMRYDFDGYGYQYIDNGSGSDWETRIKDAEPLYTTPQDQSQRIAELEKDLHMIQRHYDQLDSSLKGVDK